MLRCHPPTARLAVLLLVLCLAACSAARRDLVEVYARSQHFERGGFASVAVERQDGEVAVESIGLRPGPDAGEVDWMPVPLAPLRFVVPVDVHVPAGPDARRAANETLRCPGWAAALSSAFAAVEPAARRWLGATPLPRVSLLIAPPGMGVRHWRSSRAARIEDTRYELLTTGPDGPHCARNLPFWAADVVSMLMHELHHVYTAQRPGGPPSNLGNELSASLVEHCSRYLALGWLPYDLLAVEGLPPASFTVEWVLDQRARGALADTEAGKYLAEVLRRETLGPGTVEGLRGERFVALCDRRHDVYRVPRSTADLRAEAAAWH